MNNFVMAIRHIMEKQHGKDIQRLAAVTVENHEHSLVLCEVQNDSNSNEQLENLCNKCIEPIISTCYRCCECNYSLHLTCAQLPNELKHPGHEEHTLKLVHISKVWEIIGCRACQFYTNGYFFECEICDYRLDVKCALLPTKIVHKSHKHALLQNYFQKSLITHWKYRGCLNCNGCGNRIWSSTYSFSCEPCNFYSDHACALLPHCVNHKWDKHSLILCFPPFTDHPEEIYCEICEEEIHPKYWHYRCRECDQSFHPNCIPRLGESRNMKFGRSIKVVGHPHPITSVRQGEFRSSCGSCNESLYGQRAFKCASCKYSLCFDCVPDLVDSGKLC
ncbi:hypothetical protein ACH5RR_002741 [Cinchona calisaya]|uniref:Phorbol-ester/DAG-type domain-containing protein n=1 Tax=Cinchona calisaya TaxID=153742 RepID=A0ABD3AST9_9GENT